MVGSNHHVSIVQTCTLDKNQFASHKFYNQVMSTQYTDLPLRYQANRDGTQNCIVSNNLGDRNLGKLC